MLKNSCVLFIFFSFVMQGCSVTPKTVHIEVHSDKPVIMFILDTSGSMDQDIDGGTRISKAKDTIMNGVNQLNLGRYNVGIITFDGECGVKVVMPPNDNIDNIVNIIKSIKTDGRTPLAAAIRITGDALKNVNNKMVILLSDGIETCSGNPVVEARKLSQKYGIDINLQVIGYAVDDPTRTVLKEISQVDKDWQYHEAKDALSLKKAIDNIYTKHNMRDEHWVNPNKFMFSFDIGASNLSNKYASQIEKIYTYLKNNNKRIKIVGHTDLTGSKSSNYALSKQRAIIVKKKLIQLGVNVNRIILEGQGEDSPIASNDTQQGREQNRRVEILILQSK